MHRDFYLIRSLAKQGSEMCLVASAICQCSHAWIILKFRASGHYRYAVSVCVTVIMGGSADNLADAVNRLFNLKNAT